LRAANFSSFSTLRTRGGAKVSIVLRPCCGGARCVSRTVACGSLGPPADTKHAR
jgi:hypothetical protein